MTTLAQYDRWLTDELAAAIVIREPLMPVEGPDGVFFPATYAASQDAKGSQGGYNIDPPEGDENVCLVDSVGSQANRIEPRFGREPYTALVPQIVIRAGAASVNLLDAGHRAGDAIVRNTALQPELRAAFTSLLDGDARPMARLAPTSLVFGVWDSRDTQAKVPRLLTSTIRAYNVRKLTRSAQFVPAVDYERLELLEAGSDPKARAERGYAHVPSTGTHGGVIAKGEIRRDVVLSLAALRLLSAAEGDTETLTLRRYILGLALVALTAPPATYLRSGCNLVPHPESPRQMVLVQCDGVRESLTLSHADALAYAAAAAAAFGVGESRTIDFETARATADLGSGATGKAKKAKGAAKDAPTEG